MDRTYWIEVGQFLPGEKVILQQRVVRLYEGEERVSFAHFKGVLATCVHVYRHRSIVEICN